MTSHLDSHTTTDVKPDMLSSVQTGNGIPHDIYNIRGIAHLPKNRKDNIFKQRRLGQICTCILKWGQGTCKKSRPYPAGAYTTLVVLVPFRWTLFLIFHNHYLFPHWATGTRVKARYWNADDIWIPNSYNIPTQIMCFRVRGNDIVDDLLDPKDFRHLKLCWIFFVYKNNCMPFE